MPAPLKLTINLVELFGLKSTPNGSLDWHRFISTELNGKHVLTMLEKAKIPQDVIEETFGFKFGKTTKTLERPLGYPFAGEMHRLSLLVRDWINRNRNTEGVCEFLTSPIVELKGLVPLESFSSRVGFEAVLAYVERMAQKQDTRVWETKEYQDDIAEDVVQQADELEDDSESDETGSEDDEGSLPEIRF